MYPEHGFIYAATCSVSNRVLLFPPTGILSLILRADSSPALGVDYALEPESTGPSSVNLALKQPSHSDLPMLCCFLTPRSKDMAGGNEIQADKADFCGLIRTIPSIFQAEISEMPLYTASLEAQHLDLPAATFTPGGLVRMPICSVTKVLLELWSAVHGHG